MQVKNGCCPLHRLVAFQSKWVLTAQAQVYFCDPRSPWQRGSNENANGPRDPIDDGRNEARCKKRAASDPDAPDSRVVEKFDVFQGLTQIIEHGRSAFKKCATVAGRRNAAGAAVEQRHAHGPLQISNRSGYGGLRCVRSAAALFMLPACTTVIRI